jgi:hypothetical protein
MVEIAKQRLMDAPAAGALWLLSQENSMLIFHPTLSRASLLIAARKVCNIIPASNCNPSASVGRGAFSFPTGAWTTISEHVKLSDVGQANGEIQLFVYGKSVINVGGFILCNCAAGKIRGVVCSCSLLPLMFISLIRPPF